MGKIVAILGPTAAGKTDLAIFLCKKFNGEIISVDSRQAYRQLNIGTGKSFGDGTVPIHLYDVAKPSQGLNAHDFAQLAWEKLEEVNSRGCVSFLVGGTGFYFDVVLGQRQLAGVGVDQKLREELEKISTEELVKKLGNLDNNKLKAIDTNNRYRLIRAVEIALATHPGRHSGRVQNPILESSHNFATPQNDVLILGLTAENSYLFKRADERTDEMVRKGLLDEVRAVVKEYGWDAPGLKTLGYREFKPYFEGRVSLDEAKQRLKFNTHAYIRRQKTYFKKYFADAFWVDVGKEGFEELLVNKVESFLR